jgi:hypothetical protein
MLSYTAMRRVTASPAFKRALSTSRPALYAAQAAIPKTKLFINGEFIDSKTNKWIELRNPVNTSHLFVISFHISPFSYAVISFFTIVLATNTVAHMKMMDIENG